MKNISDTIANTLCSEGIIKKEDIDTCRYGLNVFISSMLEIVSILIIAVFMSNFFEAALFFGAFVPLRVYAGGYHADTKLRCYLVSLAVYGVFTAIMYVLSHSVYPIVNLSATLSSLVLVLAAAPVIHRNKTVTEVEKKHYRRFSIWICSVETTAILLLTAIFPKSPYIVSLAMGQASVTLSMVAAIIKGRIIDNKICYCKWEGGVSNEEVSRNN